LREYPSASYYLTRMPNKFLEAAQITITSPTKTGREWEVVLIEAGLSKNSRYYPPDVLRKAIPHFEGVKACAYRFGNSLDTTFDHLPDQASIERPNGHIMNVVGWFEAVRYGKFKTREGHEGEGLIAKFVILPAHKWLMENMKAAWESNQGGLIGFSIDAQGVGNEGFIQGQRANIVEEITGVTSTDVVSQPAAGGIPIRLAASVNIKPEVYMKDFLKVIKEHASMWLKGFASPQDGDDLQDHIVRVLEVNHAQAQEAHQAIPLDEVTRLAEVSRGVNTLATLTKLIREGKVEDATKKLQNWIVLHPIKENDPTMRIKGVYSYPFETKQAANVEASKPELELAGVKESIQEDKMPEPTIPAVAPVVPAAPVVPEVDNKLLLEQKEAQDKKDKELNVRETAIKVKERVGASELPAKAKDRVNAILAGKESLSDEEIDKVIETEREYIKTFSESIKPEGLEHAQDEPQTPVEVGKDELDKYNLAWDGFFSGRDEGKVKRFTSLHEACAQITGQWNSPTDMADILMHSVACALPTNPNRDYDKHKKMLQESWGQISNGLGSLKESITTSSLTVSFGDSMLRRMQRTYDEDPRQDWRELILAVENLKMITNPQNIIRLGGYGNIPIVNQNAPYQELTDFTETNNTLTPDKYGALAKLTWEDMVDDRVGVVRSIPDKLAKAAVRTIHETVWDLIDANTTTLISAGNSNLVTGAPALTYADLTTAVQLLRDQTEQDSGKKLGLTGSKLLVGPALETEAWEITNSKVKTSSTDDHTTSNFISSGGIKTVASIGLGRIASTVNHWYLMADPRDVETFVVGFLNGKDSPELFVQSAIDTPTSGVAFTADAITFKIRFVFGVLTQDFRGIAGSLVAA